MKFTRLSLPEVIRVTPEPKIDNRGFFSRIFCTKEMIELGIDPEVAQCNNSMTHHRGSIRGMHFQRAPFAETKIVRCIGGEVFDVAVDMRSGSKTYGLHCTSILSADNREMMVIPPGFAHGFQALTSDVELIYMASACYKADYEGGVSPLDAELKIKWPQPIGILSDRDKSLPTLRDVEPIVL